jgi:uncharacterized protein (DUF1800 family)
MNNTPRLLMKIFTGAVIVFAMCSFLIDPPIKDAKYKFPYKEAKLTSRQAAAHLLSRFTYGAKPEQVDEVVKMGLEKWFIQQLNAGLADDSLNERLNKYDAINFSNKQVNQYFPQRPKVIRMAIDEGFIDKDSVGISGKKEYKDKVEEYMKQKGFRSEAELFRQFINQKILRAIYTNNQLQEVMTDFWFNHFNVSITKNQCALYIPAYERDVIRPNVFGSFQNILLATAKSPAMLLYLDNFTSSGTNQSFNGIANRRQGQQETQQRRRLQGLNENYAREVMELHTMGVDGGYTQSDVTQAARVLTGWTIYPYTNYGAAAGMKKLLEKIPEEKLAEKGFVHEGDFLFTINRHDDDEKIVLGKKFAEGGGYKEGVELLSMLAHHQSTAKFISKKMAVRFVNDNPPQSLIDKMAKTFLEKDGDIKEVLLTMVAAHEFWNIDALREKTKSPFELAVSSIRSLDAEVELPFQLNNWITKMGQKLYFYQAPTGYPDKAQYWINTGSLLNRMNFGLALASQRILGIKFNLAALNNYHEPESANDALRTYSKLLMPERNVESTIQRLTPLLTAPDISKKVNAAADQLSGNHSNDNNMQMNSEEGMMEVSDNSALKEKVNRKNKLQSKDIVYNATFRNNSMLSQVVGIIIGSPEYQRR